MAVQQDQGTLLYSVRKFLIFQGAESVAPGKCRSFSELRLSCRHFVYVHILLVARLR